MLAMPSQHKLSKRGKYYARFFFFKYYASNHHPKSGQKTYYSYPEAQSGQKVGVQDGRASP
jgi:hypothetical protein